MIFRLRHVLVFSLLVFTGTVQASGPPPLVWRGDITTANNFVLDMAEAWHKAGHPPISLEPFNTVSGIDAVAHGTADIGGSARGRAPKRADEASLVFTPVAWDALTIITNPHNPVDNLSLKQLHDIYYGKITNWSQVGGRNKPIHVYAVASPTDGIEFSLRRLLFGRGNQPVAAPRLYLTVAKLQRAVELDPQSLGVTTLSNVHAKRKLKMLDIDGITPSVANVTNGSYALYTPLYLVTRPTIETADTPPTPREDAVHQLLAFATHSPVMADILRRHDLVPYAAAVDLDGHDAERIAAIAQETGRRIYHHHANGPVAAPGATYASRAAIAPTSQRTIDARQRMMAERHARNATKATAMTTGDKQARAARNEHAITQTGAAATTAYTVVAGDTLSKIAQAHDVSVEQLKTWNHLQSNLINVGQKIAIRHR